MVYATYVLALTIAPILFLAGLQGAFFSPLGAGGDRIAVCRAVWALGLVSPVSAVPLINSLPNIVTLSNAHRGFFAPLCSANILSFRFAFYGRVPSKKCLRCFRRLSEAHYVIDLFLLIAFESKFVATSQKHGR